MYIVTNFKQAEPVTPEATSRADSGDDQTEALSRRELKMLEKSAKILADEE